MFWHCFAGDDVVLIQVKIDDVQKRFSELRSRLDDSLEQMEEALPIARNFQEAHTGFLNWTTTIEPELRILESGVPNSMESIEVSYRTHA